MPIQSSAKGKLQKLIKNAEHGIYCKCIPEEKYIFASGSPAELLSYNERISRNIVTSLGGKIQFGNYYLGKPVVYNYLGRQEGQSGGGGAPLRNKF